MVTRPRLAAVAGSSVAAVALAAVGSALTRGNGAGVDTPFLFVSLLLGVALAGVGALLLGVRRGNRLGPLLYVAGAGLTAEFALREYAYRARIAPGSLPGAEMAAWAGLALDPLFFPVPLALVLLLFPDGRLPSRRWTPVAAAALAAVGVGVALRALRPGPLLDETFGYDVPWRGALPASAAGPTTAALGVLDTLGVLLLAVVVIGMLVRYSQTDRETRQRFKPLALAASSAVLCLCLQLIPGLAQVGVVGLVSSIAIGFPLAFAVGALRYRLWDLDRVLVAAIVYGALTVLVTGVYIGVVVGLAALAGVRTDAATTIPSVVATAIVAVLFGPVRERVGRAARRLVLGLRATPYEALAALPRQLAAAPAVDETLPRAADALALGLGVPAARVRAFIPSARLSSPAPGEVLITVDPMAADPAAGEPAAGEPAASEPVVVGLTGRADAQTAWSPVPPAQTPPDLVVVPVTSLGEVVGDVAVQPWPDRPLSGADRRLLADLAAQAGPALRGVALTAELSGRLDQITRQSTALRASRQRIATAQVEERRRLERDIHDGAQQHLLAAVLSLRTAEGLVTTASGAEDTAAAALRRCRDDLDRCIDDLRELARGIYPPVLAARGLVAAIRARARTAPGTVRVTGTESLNGQRLPRQTEAAAYFACLEAMQNAAKHAPGAAVRVDIGLADGVLSFTVNDDGPGFDPAAAEGGGTGLLGMADRVGAAGGALSIRSAPGNGTTVSGRLPASPLPL